MTRKLTRISAAVLMSLVFALSARAADLKDPNEIIKKSWAKISSLNSYSYSIWAEGWETNMADIQKRNQSAAGEAASKFGGRAAASAKEVTADPNKWKYMKYHTTMKFMKPYLLQMNVVQSDYVPKVIYGSLMTYRPDQDPNVFWIKLRFSPIALKRDIKSESGNILYSTVNMQFIMMDGLGQDTKPVLRGIEKVQGHDAYAVAFEFKKGQLPKKHPVNFNKWGSAIPKQVRFALEKESNFYPDLKDVSRVVYFFDKETLWLVGTEYYNVDGKKIFRKEWRDIKENSLSDRDF